MFSNVTDQEDCHVHEVERRWSPTLRERSASLANRMSPSRTSLAQASAVGLARWPLLAEQGVETKYYQRSLHVAIDLANLCGKVRSSG